MKYLMLFAILFLGISKGFAQEDSSLLFPIPILSITNPQLDVILEEIVCYESSQCDGPNSCYFIDKKSLDSEISQISISSSKLEEVLDKAYGVFFIGKCAFFVNESMDPFFIESFEYEVFLKDIKGKDFWGAFDGYETIWTFLFKNLNFEFESFYGFTCDTLGWGGNPLEKHLLQKIDRVEEKIEDFPLQE